MTELPITLAKKMVRQLGAGTTPLEGVRYLNVGRERYFVEIEGLLEDLNEGGGAAVHFINADYGYGKTHFIGMTNALALDRNWVTSYVKVSKADGLRLDKFEQLYAAILRNCICRGLLEAHQHTYDPGEKNGWPWILDDWIKRHLATEAGAGIDQNSLGARQRTIGALELLLRKANVTGNFAAAVQLYAKSFFEQTSNIDRQLRENVLRWFNCEKIPELREHGVLAPITNADAKQVLRSIIGILREFGYAGMAIFIDEAESVQEYTKPQRRVAYQNLRELLDNMDGRASGMSLNHAVCYVAATPVMFLGEKGFREYPALQDRIDEIKLPFPNLTDLIDYRAVVVDLSMSPLTREDCRDLAKKIRQIHSICYQWNPSEIVDDDWLESIVVAFDHRRGELGGLRPLCRAVAKSLQLAHQHPDTFSGLEPKHLVASSFQQESLSS